MNKFIPLIMICGLSFGGCANLNGVSRLKPAPKAGEGMIYTVDAKQRHLIMSRVNGRDMRVCAEAAPDVFSAFAASLAAEGSLTGGQLGLSSNETAATIERTQTINMLRESFYRTCERYLSGAITKPQLIVQAARDQRSMVTILAIEQLTGVARGSSTIISPGGTAAGVISGGDAAKLIRDYDERLQKAKATRVEADKAFKQAADKECSKTPDSKDADAAKCTALELAATDAASKEADAQKSMDNITAIAKDIILASSASTTAGQSIQGNGSVQADAARVIGVSDAIVEIVKLSSIDEPLMFCLGFVGSRESSSNPNSGRIVEGCMKILQDRNRADLQIRGAAGLDVDALKAYATGRGSSHNAQSIMKLLIEKIEASSLEGLNEKIKAFQTRAGFDPKVDISGKCDTILKCVAAVRDEYIREISLNLEKAKDAVSKF